MDGAVVGFRVLGEAVTRGLGAVVRAVCEGAEGFRFDAAAFRFGAVVFPAPADA
ncbi:hypothetical protein AB0D38_29820 [Streptomyces sp. NPDC048279]|uniref:hypothetical protein n=1 Tax=Streptomyces sp. NPDC048279 TaxID=3154714 RepID=UPI0034131418